MDFNTIKEFIAPITLVFCLGLGQIVKAFPKVNSKYIPAIVGFIGVLFNVWAVGNITPQSITVGLISGLSATGAFELFKNLKTQDTE